MTFDLLTYTRGRVESQESRFNRCLPDIANGLLERANERGAINSNGADVYHTVIPAEDAIAVLGNLFLEERASLRALEDHFTGMGISVRIPDNHSLDITNFELSWTVRSLETAIILKEYLK